MTVAIRTLRAGSYFRLPPPPWAPGEEQPVQQLHEVTSSSAHTTLGYLAGSTDVIPLPDYQPEERTEPEPQEPRIAQGDEPEQGSLSAQVLAFAREHAAERPANGWLTVAELDAAVVGARRCVRGLVAAGLMAKQGQGRGTRYRAQGGGE